MLLQYSNPTEINKGELAEPVQVFIPAYVRIDSNTQSALQCSAFEVLTNNQGVYTMNQAEAQAMQDLLATLHRKLGLAMTCGAYHRGTNKKTVESLELQINTLYKLCGVDHRV